MDRTTNAPAESPAQVAYVMTHHPRTALTFIDLEIRELERSGVRVVPIAVNPPDPDDVTTEAARAAERATLYLKRDGPARLALAVARTAVRHPAGTARLAARAVSSARLDLPLAARRLVHLAYACRSWDLLRENGVRHVHAHFGQTPATVAWFIADVAALDGEPCTWSFTIHGFQDFADERLTRLDLKAASASAVVCVSDFTRAQLYRVTDPATWDRAHVVRCGIDLHELAFRPPPRRERRPRILTVARLSPEKGHLVLLDALAGLRRDGVDAEVRIVGGGPSAALIADAADRLGLGDRVALLGELAPPAVADELRDADVFCLPSFAEGIPVSVMEAMAIGVPVVTTYVGGIPELAVDGETALVVPASDASGLAAAIARLVTDPALGERLAAAARRAVEERHDIRRNVAALRDVLPLTR